MNLKGDRNQCPACGEHFNSTAAFDMHRYGPMYARQCLTPHEMEGKGMARSMSGYWITAPMPDTAWETREAIGQECPTEPVPHA